MTPDQPLKALWHRYRNYRGRFIAAVLASVVNKVADVVPECLRLVTVDDVYQAAVALLGAT